MIKVELSKTVSDKIEKLHKNYILQTSVYEIEKIITLQEQKYKFLEVLFGDTKEKRESCIIRFCLSNDLEKLIEIFNVKFYRFYNFSCRQPKDSKEEMVVKEIQGLMDDILCYDKFNRGIKLECENGEKCEWNRHLFVVNIGAKVCPYCNRQYITSYIADNEAEKTTADVDHYYPKSLYPYLQMNIYNMIPSCTVCNSKMKGKSDKRHLYPYLDSTDSLKFEVPLDNIEKLYAVNMDKIVIKDKDNPRARDSIRVFKLDKVYQVHMGDVLTVINNMKNYEAFKELYYKKTMGIDLGNIFSVWFDFLSKNPLDEPLVKLKKDIYYQLLTSIRRE